MRFKIVTKIMQFHVIVGRNSMIKTKQFSICSKHIICLDYDLERWKCSTVTLTHAFRSWRHWWNAHVWWYGLPSSTE